MEWHGNENASKVRKALPAHIGADPRRKFWKSYQNSSEGEISGMMVRLRRGPDEQLSGSASEWMETRPENSESAAYHITKHWKAAPLPKI